MASASRRARNSGSTQARATTRAPFIGPTFSSKFLMSPARTLGSTSPRSVRMSSRASVRIAGVNDSSVRV